VGGLGHFLPPIASDQQRPPSGKAELLKYWAMVHGNIIDDLDEIKGDPRESGIKYFSVFQDGRVPASHINT